MLDRSRRNLRLATWRDVRRRRDYADRYRGRCLRSAPAPG
ncbi:hypothetical protein LG3211_2625 [Lysobacter gummosus]|nr:hypothetical protein LG3211_2625 [Lysobacter gummosus]